MFERPSADVTSIEEMASQKTVSNARVSAYPPQVKGWHVQGGPVS